MSEWNTSWHAIARDLAASGWKCADIAREVGHGYAAVYKVLHPEKARAYNAKFNSDPQRVEAKRRWDLTEQAKAGNRRRMDERYRAPCVKCGAKMCAGSLHRDIERCRSCEDADRAARHEELLDKIELMWNEQGMTGPEISYALGRNHHASADGDIQELRRAGRLLPRQRQRSAAA